MRRKVNQKRVNEARNLANAVGHERMLKLQSDILESGKSALDALAMELGRRLVEGVFLMEREQIAGPEYKPKYQDIQKGGKQQGSVYIGGTKVPVMKPRIQGPEGEITLKSFEKMRNSDGFSEELLAKSLNGLSGRRYEETVEDVAGSFGISRSSVSRHVVKATAAQLKEFRERSLSEFKAFAILLDTIHRGGRAFIVALGIDTNGKKIPLGFWEGATENSEICIELFSDLERRGLACTNRMIYVTDGGKGIIKCLQDLFGGQLLHQRCTLHKERNIERHLAKKYRKEAVRRFRIALDCKKYQDAKEELDRFEIWLREINESAANSLLEAKEQLLTLHRLEVGELLRKTLHTTNPIESMFATVRGVESKIKRWRSTAMAQRWLSTTLMHAEKGFRRVRGFKEIADVISRIDKLSDLRIAG